MPRLVASYGSRLYALGARMCGDAQLAEDLVQETFLQAHLKWSQFSGDRDPAPWLYRIATRICQRMHRRRAGEPARVESLEELLPYGQPRSAVVPASAAGGLDEQLQAEALSRLQDEIAALPQGFRMPLVLKDIVGFTVPQVAAVLGIQEGTAKSRIHRARMRLRRALEAVLPRRKLPPSPYGRQVCLDLVRAKLEALDRGVDMPPANRLISERCEAVFATLDLIQTLCQKVAVAEMPASFREALMLRVAQP